MTKGGLELECRLKEVFANPVENSRKRHPRLYPSPFLSVSIWGLPNRDPTLEELLDRKLQDRHVKGLSH